MFKKIVLILSATLTLSFAVSDEDILLLYDEVKSIAPDAKVKVSKREKVGSEGLEKITVSVFSQGYQVDETIYARDNFIFLNSVDMEQYKKQQKDKK